MYGWVDVDPYGSAKRVSCKKPISVNLNNQKIDINATLIRAPKVISNSDSVDVLATIDKSPAVVMQGKHLGLSFHPELDGVTIFHEILFNPSSKFYQLNLNKVNAA